MSTDPTPAAQPTPATDDMPRCRVCGHPEARLTEIVSRHRTSEGVVTYSRGPCGHLQVQLLPFEAQSGTLGPVIARATRVR